MGGQMELYSIYCGSVVYKDKEDKERMECGQKGEEKDTQVIPLADLQEVFVFLQSAHVTSQQVFVDLQSPHATPQRVFVDLQSAHATLQGVFVGLQFAHATPQGVFVDLQSAPAPSQQVIWCIKCAHTTLQRVIGCIKCTPAIFFALFGGCVSAGLSTVARQTNPNRSCRRAGVAF